MKKILFVIPVYNKEINGGMELHARMIAEEIAKESEVTVLTTKISNYSSLENNISVDSEMLNGVTVIRKKVDFIRKSWIYAYLLSILLRLSLVFPIFTKYWLKLEGPYSPELLAWYRDNCRNYDAVVFFKTFAWTTVECLKVLHRRRIIVPLVHADRIIDLNFHQELFNNCEVVIFNSETERDLVLSKYSISSEISVTGIWASYFKSDIDESDLRKKYGLGDAKILLYVGRIETGKGADILINYFNRYTQENRLERIKLIFIGKLNNVDMGENKDIIYLGFLDDNEKNKFIDISYAVVIPSKFESLSMILLEALMAGKRCIVNSACNVLNNFAKKQQGVIGFSNYDEFRLAVKSLEFIQIPADANEDLLKKYSKESIMEQWRRKIND